MTTVLVTGPMGSGKSLACAYLESEGFPVYDCDSRCKALYDSVPGLRARIESELGIPMGELGRIFTSDSLRSRLEAIVYPILAGDIRAWKDSQSSAVAFIESATALGRPEFEGLWDRVLKISAPASLRSARKPESARRSALQRFPAALVDRTIRNNGTPGELYRKIDTYLKTLL
mgnify:CR=1 FL=1